MAAHRSKLVDGLAFVSVLCFVLAGLALLQQVQSLADAAGWVAHTREVLQGLDRASLDMREAEASQRGYLLTDDEMFLDAFQAATENTGRTLTMLSRLTRDNPRQQATLEELAPAARRRLDLLRQNLDRRRSSRPLDLEVARAGVASMKVVNGLADQLRTEEERLLQDRLRASDSAKLELQVTAVGTAALGLVLLLALRTVAHRDRGRLLRARAAAEGTQERLQAIVDGAPALIYLKDREGRFVLVNRATLHLLDRSPEQVLGRGAAQARPAAAEPRPAPF